MNTFKKMFKITEKKRAYSFISKILVVLVLVFGIYTTYSVGVISKISMISSITSSSGESSQPNVLGVITSYLGVIALFSIIVFYIEKLLTKRKRGVA